MPGVGVDNSPTSGISIHKNARHYLQVHAAGMQVQPTELFITLLPILNLIVLNLYTL